MINYNEYLKEEGGRDRLLHFAFNIVRTGGDFVSELNDMKSQVAANVFAEFLMDLGVLAIADARSQVLRMRERLDVLDPVVVTKPIDLTAVQELKSIPGKILLGQKEEFKLEFEDGVVEQIQKLAMSMGGDITSIRRLPDGSGRMIGSFPLPKDHWLYNADAEQFKGAPFELVPAFVRDSYWRSIKTCVQEALRRATDFGKVQDFDPDVLLQNLNLLLFGNGNHNLTVGGVMEMRHDQQYNPADDNVPAVGVGNTANISKLTME